MSCCELFFFCQTLVSKTASWMKLFLFFSPKDMSWDEAEKSSLLQLSLSFLSLIYVRSSWWSYFTKHFFQNSLASSRKLLIKLFSKKTALLVKLSCIKQGLSYISRSLCLHRDVVKGAEQLVEKQGGREESVGSAADELFKALFVSTGLTCFRAHSKWITITRF